MTAPHPDRVEYLLVQYVDDVLRRESTNVGVVARRGNQIAASFLGERAPGDFDNRVLRRFAVPEVYQQWVGYWRALLAEPDAFHAISATQRANFPVLEGGAVTDTDGDSLDHVAAYLYTLLVAQGGFAKALGVESEDSEPTAKLATELEVAFAAANILMEVKAGKETPPALVQAPIRRLPKLQGRGAVTHTPSFAQENGRLFVMETVDFTQRQRERSRDHAGYAAYMFDDLRKANPAVDVAPIALIRVTDAERGESLVESGLEMLKETAEAVVNWLDAAERGRFIEERRKVAVGSP